MSISFIAAASAASTTLTLPTGRAALDLEVMWAFRNGSATSPTIPSGWTVISSIAGTSCIGVLAYRVCTSSSDTSGTWTSATHLECSVYRGALGVGAVASSAAASTTINYPTLSLVDASGKSWVCGVAGHRTASNVSTAPTGMTNRTSVGTGPQSAMFDSNGGLTSWSSTNVTVNANSGHVSAAFELLDHTTWNPFDKFSAITLSNHNLTFSSGAEASAVRSATSKSSGLVVVGFTINVSSFAFIGVDNGASALTHDVTGSANSNGWSFIDFGGSPSWNYGSSFNTVAFNWAPGDSGFLAINFNTGKVWIRFGAYVWNNDGSADPEAGTGGYSAPSLIGSKFYLIAGGDGATTHSNITLDPTAAGHGLSSFTPWDSSATGYTLTADVGAFTLSGQAVNLTVGRSLVAATGAFAVSGLDVALPVGRNLTAATGAYTLAGQDLALTLSLRLAADAGAYVLSGQDAGLAVGRVVAAETGAFTLAGIDAGLVVGRALGAEAGAFVVAGQDVGLSLGLTLACEPGSFDLVGYDVDLSTSSGLTLDAETGAFVITASDVGLIVVRRLAADTGAYTLSGQDVALPVGRTLAAARGAFTLTGESAALICGYQLAADVGVFQLAAQDVAFPIGRVLAAATGEFAITGYDVALTVGGEGPAVTLGGFTIQGQRPGFDTTGSAPGAAFTGRRPAVSLTGHAPRICLTGTKPRIER